MQEDQATPENLATAEAQTATESTVNPEVKIAELEKALEEAKAQVLYIKAEGENIRRRAGDDIDKARKFALEKFSGELLAVKDSLDAALAIDSADVASYKNGVDLTAFLKNSTVLKSIRSIKNLTLTTTKPSAQ